MLVAYCSGDLDPSLNAELEASHNQQKTLPDLGQHSNRFGFFFPVSVKSKYQTHSDVSKAWPGEGLSNHNSWLLQRGRWSADPTFRFWKLLYPHEEDYSLTPFSTASVKAGINPSAFLITALLIPPSLIDLCCPPEINASRERVVRKKPTTLWFSQDLVLPL